MFVDFPLGSPCGAPFDAAMQTRIVEAVLDLLESAEGPNTTVAMPLAWPGGEGWKSKVFTPEQPFLSGDAVEGREARKPRYREQSGRSCAGRPQAVSVPPGAGHSPAGRKEVASPETGGAGRRQAWVRRRRPLTRTGGEGMDLGVEGKVAIVTGGSEGIGRAAAARLSAEGAKVAIVARTQADLERAAAEIGKQTGNEVIGIATDVRSESSVKAMVDAVVARWGRLDILVNNAGTSSASRFEAMTDEQLEEDFTLKVKGAVYCTRHALPHLKQSRGVICNTTTPGGKAPRPGSQPTALSRAAGISLTKAWSHEFAADGVRVNTVCVGLLKSRQHRRRWEGMNAKDPGYSLEDHYRKIGASVPLGRVGEAEEAGDVIAFLCSDRASYVTGAAVNIDGGTSPVV